ncbi:MAG: hypothetical protein PHO64_11950 [Thiomonas sp.]|nr:hypothetical protein [Thiomonas sp.]
MKAPELRGINHPPPLRGGAKRATAQASVCVLGAGDVASAVGHVLHRHGCAVWLVEGAQPAAPRRGMCWADAVFDGAATLSGLAAHRVSHTAEALAAFAHRAWAPLVVEPDLPAWLIELGAGLVVDARLRKHDAIQPDLHDLAAWSVGIGPGYCAMHNATYVVESAWGDGLGRVIRKGAASALCGEPRPILGAGRDRLVYAPEAGRFLTQRRIGDPVLAGEVLAQLQTESGKVLPLRAPLSGVVRGLTRGGVRVPTRAKLIEVDPRNDPKHCFGLGERPMKIAEGVLLAVAELLRHAAAYEESGPRAASPGHEPRFTNSPLPRLA